MHELTLKHMMGACSPDVRRTVCTSAFLLLALPSDATINDCNAGSSCSVRTRLISASDSDPGRLDMLTVQWAETDSASGASNVGRKFLRSRVSREADVIRKSCDE